MITRQDIEGAQAAWAEAVVAVGEAPSWEEAHERATSLVQTLYLLEDGTLLFCPTLAAQQQFRTTLEDAVSYFVGHGLPEDGGFALQSWKSIRFENAGIVCREGVGISMGNYFFAKADGPELKVEYTLVHVRDSAGDVKIQLHHSALPYRG
jgi:hypothetical protein